MWFSVLVMKLGAVGPVQGGDAGVGWVFFVWQVVLKWGVWMGGCVL